MHPLILTALLGVAPITIDYPAEGSIFSPEFPAPVFLWRDTARGAVAWTVEVKFSGGASPIRVPARAGRMRTGEIDPRCNGATNKPPKLTPEQAAARTWTPSSEIWAAIKKGSAKSPATVTITGYNTANQAVSRGQVTIHTSADPVGAPIFYRDVPLMPSETEKGVIKPLATSMMPLIAWRLRDVAEPRSTLLLEGVHSCMNCHSFSRDGKTMGLDVDGPLNDKGLYGLVPVQRRTAIRKQDVISWSTFRGKLGGKLRVGFMSQVSPDGNYVVTTINDAGEDQSDYLRRKAPKDLVSNYYVANFADYRFLQVFYPTRGILAWYNRDTGRLQPLPGADDPRYVHTNAVWSPDGKYLVFARAEAKDAYAPGAKLAVQANDPAETQIRYDLYRIPFNGGKGGVAQPVAGASQNGMSNSFPKISPDGRWIVYVRARNGLLMRPDGQLYIVPAGGGQSRRMRCNTPLMNSWHSFSPNGRWMVFSSKSRSPYTQMFLTHLDEDGNDSPPILIENATAANRAVNIPEFVNVPPGGLRKLEAPATDYYGIVDVASDLAKSGKHEAAAAEWKKAVELSPEEAPAHLNLGLALAEMGKSREAAAEYEKALELSPDYAEAHNNLGNALVRDGKLNEAIAHYEKALETNPRYPEAHSGLGAALMQEGRLPDAIAHYEKAIEYNASYADAHNNLGIALAMSGRLAEAIPHVQRAIDLTDGRQPMIIGLLARMYAEMGRFAEAAQAARRAMNAAIQQNDRGLAESLKSEAAAYESRIPR